MKTMHRSAQDFKCSDAGQFSLGVKTGVCKIPYEHGAVYIGETGHITGKEQQRDLWLYHPECLG
jgi:hypothetical protein